MRLHGRAYPCAECGTLVVIARLRSGAKITMDAEPAEDGTYGVVQFYAKDSKVAESAGGILRYRPHRELCVADDGLDPGLLHGERRI